MGTVACSISQMTESAGTLARRLGFRLRPAGRVSRDVPVKQLQREIAEAFARWEQRQALKMQRTDSTK